MHILLLWTMHIQTFVAAAVNIVHTHNIYINSTYSSMYNVFYGHSDVTTVVQESKLQLNNISLIYDQLVIPNLEFGIWNLKIVESDCVCDPFLLTSLKQHETTSC